MSCYEKGGQRVNYKELLLFFPYHKISIVSKDILGHDRRRICKDQEILKIFSAHVQFMFDDLILYNGMFHLPLGGITHGYVHIEKMNDKTLKKLRKRGKCLDFDLLATGFKAYSMRINCGKYEDMSNVYIFPGRKNHDKIVEKANRGFNYDGDSKYDFYVEDYVERIQELYPTVKKEDIEIILKYSWKMLYLYIRFGCEFKLRIAGGIMMVIQYANGKEFSDRYSYNLAKRLYILLINTNFKSDGYAYFYISKNLHEQCHDKVTSKDGFKFDYLMVYKSLDLCIGSSTRGTYIYRVKDDFNIYFLKRPMWNCVIKNAELLDNISTKRKERILVSKANYEVLKKVPNYRREEKKGTTPVEGYTEDGKIVGLYMDMYKAAEATGAKRPNIWFTCEGKRESAGKYNGKKIKWRYLEGEELDAFIKKYRNEKKRNNQHVRRVNNGPSSVGDSENSIHECAECDYSNP